MKSLGTRPCSQKPHETAARPFFSKTSSREAETQPFFAPTLSITPPKLQAESEEGDLKEQEEPLQTKRIEGLTASDPIRRQQEPEEERKLLQAKGTGERDAPSSVRQGLGQTRGSGRTMEPSLQKNMEESFGRDFSEVRLHTGDSAQAMNRDLNAKAFTHGRDVYFSSGEFNAESREGRRLLAHELTHVVQQGKAELRLQQAGETKPLENAAESPAPAVGADAGVAAMPDAGTAAEPATDAGVTAAAVPVKGAAKPGAAPQAFDETLKRKWIAVVLAESAAGDENQEKYLAWLYYNDMLGAKENMENGLKLSSEYQYNLDRYRVWLYQQGETSVGATPLKKKHLPEFQNAKGIPYKTVAALWSDRHAYYQEIKGRLDRVRGHVKAILADPGKNPIKGFANHGNLADFNNLNRYGLMWQQARHYFYLQNTDEKLKGNKDKEWVKFLPAKRPFDSQFFFHLANIQKELIASGVDLSMKNVEVPFVDVVNGEAVFVNTRDKITALPEKKKPKAAPKQSAVPAESPAPPAKQENVPSATPAPSSPVKIQPLLKTAESAADQGSIHRQEKGEQTATPEESIPEDPKTQVTNHLKAKPATNKAYAEWVLKAKELGFVIFCFSTPEKNLDAIIKGEKIGSVDPSKPDIIPALVLLHTLVSKAMQKWIDKGGEKPLFNVSSLVRQKGQGFHTSGRAVDITGYDFTSEKSVNNIIEILESLDIGTYEIGLPFQGPFFDLEDKITTEKLQELLAEEQKRQKEAKSIELDNRLILRFSGYYKVRYDGTASPCDRDNEKQRDYKGAAYKRLKNAELIKKFEQMKKDGFTLTIIPDNDGHIHVGNKP